MSNKSNGVSLALGNGENIMLNAEITFNVQDKGESNAAHLSDVIYKLILEKLKAHPQASLITGEYRLGMTVFVSKIPPAAPVAVEDQAQALVKEILPDEVPNPDDQ